MGDDVKSTIGDRRDTGGDMSGTEMALPTLLV